MSTRSGPAARSEPRHLADLLWPADVDDHARIGAQGHLGSRKERGRVEVMSNRDVAPTGTGSDLDHWAMRRVHDSQAGRNDARRIAIAVDDLLGRVDLLAGLHHSRTIALGLVSRPSRCR